MSPLDLPLHVSIFTDFAARTIRRETLSLRQLLPLVLATSAASKAALPWLKLAVFGEVRSPKGALRHNANLTAISGVELDYDAELTTMNEAAAMLQAAGLAALLYDSPSSMADLPRWRILLPCSKPLPAGERTALAARVNGVLGGTLSVESFTLSQAYYFGFVTGNTQHRAVLVDGRPIDLAPELDTGARYPARATPAQTVHPVYDPGATPDQHALAAQQAAVDMLLAMEGGDTHPTLLRATALVAPFVLAGLLDEDEVSQVLAEACEDAVRIPNLGEMESALAGALRKMRPYEPATGGTEFEAAPLPPVVRPGGRGSMLDRLVFPADCATGPRRGYIVKHVLAPGDVGAIIAPPGAGKSMLAPYLAYAVAQGREVFGLRTKQGRALYIAAEDAGGMRQRIHALRLRHGDAPAFAMVDCGNLRDAGEAADLRATVAAWKPALVVIDTLGAAFAGMDENSSTDMGDVVALARNLAAAGAAVLLIHHTAKHGDGTPRGHSVLNGTLDMSLSLQPKDDGGIIRGTMLKNRNGTTDRDIAFRYIAVPLGQDEDGDPITAPMAVELEQGVSQARRPKLSGAAQSALRVLHEMAEGGPVAEADWRARCDDTRAVSTADKPDSRERAFRRAYGDLRDAGEVIVGDGMVRTARGQPETVGNAGADSPGQEADKADMSGQHSHRGSGRTRTAPYRLSGCPPLGAPEFEASIGEPLA